MTIESFYNIITSTPNTHWIYAAIVALFGLLIGSFLNVVIYRNSAKYLGSNYKGNLGINEPKGSFCPQCLHPLSWVENIPLLSWLVQKGQCKHCSCPISIQYPAVEATNAILWTLCWLQSPTIGQFVVSALTISLLIAVTGIDIKCLKIPNKISLGGTLAILAIGSLLVPNSFLHRVEGIFIGFGVTFLIIQLGKILFGKKKVKMKTPVDFEWNQEEKTLTIQEENKTLKESEALKAEDLFTRKTDCIEIFGDITTSKGKSTEERLQITYNKACLVSKTDKVDIGEQEPIRGKMKSIVFPREAMGMGDAKLMALIGASLGVILSLKVVFFAACAGAIFGITLRLIKAFQKQNPPNTIAFGPWLSAAAVFVLLFYRNKCI